MGIKNLSQFLKKREIYELKTIDVLRYKKIAIDTPMFLYKFKSAFEPKSTEWLGCFLNLIVFLRKHDIHPIFVFEGKSPPEKAETQKIRREQRDKIVDKTDTIETSLNCYETTGTVNLALSEIQQFISKKSIKKTLLVREKSINVKEIRDEITRRRRFEVSIKPEDILNLKELLDITGVCHIQSMGEAETDCVSLFYSKIVDYVVSEDTDVFAYHGGDDERQITSIVNFNVSGDTPTFTQISKQKILDTLKLSSESFRDFCIMCGTDYNKNIFKIGVEKSYVFLSNFKCIENIPIDCETLKHTMVRELFRLRSIDNLPQQQWWCRMPTTEFEYKLTIFMFNSSIKNVSFNNVYNALTNPNLAFDG